MRRYLKLEASFEDPERSSFTVDAAASSCMVGEKVTR
jgi:hypothetical protein